MGRSRTDLYHCCREELQAECRADTGRQYEEAVWIFLRATIRLVEPIFSSSFSLALYPVLHAYSANIRLLGLLRTDDSKV